MASEVDLCSDALTLLGDTTITSLAEDSNRARLCARHYPKVRDFVIADHPWNEATVRQALNEQVDAPVFGWDNAFPLPTDPFCLRPLRTSLDPEEGGDGAAWGVEIVERVKCLVTDESTVDLVYLGRITDPNLFSPGLYQAIVFRLAWSLAYPITGSLPTAKAMLALYQQQVKDGRRQDGQIGSTRSVRSNTLIDVRRQS